MRIGLIAPPWIPVPPPAYGGIESMVDALARGLAAAGHEVLLAAAAGTTCPVPKVPGAPAADPATMGACADELRHSVFACEAMDSADLIHDHTLAGLPRLEQEGPSLMQGKKQLRSARSAKESAVSRDNGRSIPGPAVSR
jgi:hypothetical protein